MKTNLSITRILLIAGVLPLFLISCIDTRKATYFNGVTDGEMIKTIPIPEPILNTNDIISISVTSLNPEATVIFNTPNYEGQNGGRVNGYLINSNGTFQFPILGTIQASGLTIEQLRESLVSKLVSRQLLTDPIISIRRLNFKVTVLGEVGRPTVIPVDNEKISLLEAIGLAGDLTIYAKRENVLVIREEKGEKVIKRLNLNSDELFKSPYFYLQSDDVVYVEPNKAKVASTSRSIQWLPVIFGAMSLAFIVIDRVVK